MGRSTDKETEVERGSSVWVAEHGWCYLNAIIDSCTREIVGWSLELRCRAANERIYAEKSAGGAPAAGALFASPNGSALLAGRHE